jgi:hypothetical protein
MEMRLKENEMQAGHIIIHVIVHLNSICSPIE